jgi:exopolysaccharide biosynthesis protein
MRYTPKHIEQKSRRSAPRTKPGKKQNSFPKKALAFLGYNFVLIVILAPFIVFKGPFQALKTFAVDTIYTSRHPQVVTAFLSDAEIASIMNLTNNEDVVTGIQVDRSNVTTDTAAGITVEDIQGKNFKGKVMLIDDPKRVKIAVTDQLGVTGARVTDMTEKAGAIAGINAGGFYDPNGKGNGAFPDGITVHEGKIVHNNVGDTTPVHIIGLDADGTLILKDLTATQVLSAGITEAVTFTPDLIVNGKAVLKGDGGWGIAPRTGIGQTADGTIIFVVIDGRQPTWSLGATLRDLMNVFVEYKAVTAVNLDGGSSAELVYNGDVMNKPCDVFGERYIPTAFVVMPK